MKIYRKKYFRHMNSSPSSVDRTSASTPGDGSVSEGSFGDLPDNSAKHLSSRYGSASSLSNGRFQEEAALSADYDAARIDLRTLISSPSDMKGLHATLQSASRSVGDKDSMSMTIEDIQNILKDEFRRRASQTASVEIWKALLVVGGLLFILYWGRIGKDIASETAKVTTLTLQDEQLQAKAFELANVIVRIFFICTFFSAAEKPTLI
jgi:hypothetical protein